MPKTASSVDPTTGICTKCGQVHERCAGHNKTGKPCRKYPINGGTVCMTHGGAAPQVRAAANRRLAAGEAERSLRKTLADVDVHEITDPVDTFRRITSEVIALKDFFAERVADLNDELRFTDKRGNEQLDARVALYERALNRSGKFLETWIRLGMEERLTRVQEQLARDVGNALLAAAAELGLDAEDDRVRSTLAKHLRVIDGGQSA